MLTDQETPAWTTQDKQLVVAYQAYLEGLCHECGRPIEECKASVSWVDINTRVCSVKEAEDLWREQNPDTDPGTVLVPTIEGPPGGAQGVAPPNDTNE